MPYRPIEAMNNSSWQTARRKAGFGDLHVHDLRHTDAMILEVFEALEKIKNITNRLNVSLVTLKREAHELRLPQKSPTQKKTG